VLGVAHPVDAPVLSVRAERRFEGGRVLPAPVSVAPNVVPGLSIVGRSAEVPWPPGYYRLAVETPGGEESLVVCLGEVGASGSSVDSETASEGAYLAAQATTR
jgi:hypothetical protein